MPFHSCSCFTISRNGFSLCMLYADTWHAAINSTMGYCDLLPLYLAPWLANLLDQWALLTLLQAIPGCTRSQRKTWQMLPQTKRLRYVLPTAISSYRNVHSAKPSIRVRIGTCSGGFKLSHPSEHLLYTQTSKYRGHAFIYHTHTMCLPKT